MRRRISLYIGGFLADMDDDSLVIMTYTVEDAQNPTVVRNSYSRQVTLPGTGRNSAIFGAYYRLDRRIDRQNLSPVGTGFTPTQKVPFQIYDELGEILESGYLRLDKVTRRGGVVSSYAVTLFGGLGSFFYLLSYSQEGNKLNLADLDYIWCGPDEMAFRITAAAVSQAWTRLAQDLGEVSQTWDVFNFAPCYNGFPDNFDADKAVLNPSQFDIPVPETYDGESYDVYPGTGHTLINLAEAVDEWAAKDLRSYLQRPVISVRGLCQGIERFAAARGWTFDHSAVPYKARLWMTLPMLNLAPVQQDISVSFSVNSPGTDSHYVATLTPTPAVSGQLMADVGLDFYLTFDSTGNKFIGLRDALTGIRPFSIVFIQVVNDVIPSGGSKVGVIAPTLLRTWTPQQLADACSFVPEWSRPGEDKFLDTVFSDYLAGGGGTWDTDGFHLDVDTPAFNQLYIKVYAYDMVEDAAGNIAMVDDPDNGDYSTPTLYDAAGNDYQTTDAYAALDDWWVRVKESLFRSNAVVNKRILLSGTATPAEYLTAIAKAFGLSFLVDGVSKTVKLVSRNDYYQNETIDLTDRIDTGKESDVLPLALSAKWYDFAFAGDAAKFWDEYVSNYGRTYGLQRVNTGYDFDAGVVDLLDGIALKGAATILDYGPYWNYIEDGGDFFPSPFLQHGVTYTLYSPSGQAHEFQVSNPGPTATVSYYNLVNGGYDLADGGRMEFRDKDRKMLDGSGVLCFYNGMQAMQHFHLSDDLTDMNVLNNGRPCWIFNGLGGSISVPAFGRYQVSGGVITDSLDFGVPFELAIPGIDYPADASLYAKAWQAYLADRYDADTKVLHGWVDFTGIQVGPELLRKFYWYDGSIWVLNKIVNYSLTTWDPVECEFVQVQDPDNYLNGQTL